MAAEERERERETETDRQRQGMIWEDYREKQTIAEREMQTETLVLFLEDNVGLLRCSPKVGAGIFDQSSHISSWVSYTFSFPFILYHIHSNRLSLWISASQPGPVAADTNLLLTLASTATMTNFGNLTFTFPLCFFLIILSLPLSFSYCFESLSHIYPSFFLVTYLTTKSC